MRARLLALGLVPLALAACGGGSTASKTPAKPATQAKAVKTQPVMIKVVSVMQTTKSHRKSPNATSPGDSVDFADVLLNTSPAFGKGMNEQIGTDSGTMTFTSASTARMEGKTTLPDGTISFSGEVTVLPNKNLVVPIVGGTGRYANASGTLLVGSGSKRAPNTYSLYLAGGSGPVA